MGLRDHERQRTEVRGATLEFDKLSARQVFGNEVPRQVPPAETGPEQVALGAGVVDHTLALARDALLGLLRFRLVVRDDDLDMQAEFVRGDGALCRSEGVGWGAWRHHLALDKPAAVAGIRVTLRPVIPRRPSVREGV